MGSTGQTSKLREAWGAQNRGLDLKVYVKDVRDRHGRKRPLTVRPWSTVKDVKDQLQQLLLVPPSAQRLFLGGPLQIHGRELPNHWTLQDAGIYRSGETLLFDIKDGYCGGSSGADTYSLIVPETQQGSSCLASTHSVNSFVPDSITPHKLSSDISISSSMIDFTPRLLRQVVQKSRRGLLLGFKPELGLDGSGGTYFLHDARKVKIAVFKPADEEPYAENNPRGYVDTTSESSIRWVHGEDDYGGGLSLRLGIIPGESCLREVAAFMLDHDSFSGVPMTTLAEARHPAFHVSGSRLKVYEGGASIGSHSLSAIMMSPNLDGVTSPKPVPAILSPSEAVKAKIGSFQEFVNAECSMDDLSPSKIRVEEVHKIAILDIRLMNADRNLANLLVRRRTDDILELVPIDHGYCLRSVCDVSWFDWCWLDWPQLKKPLSKKFRDYVLNLDIEEDVRLLKEMLDIGTKALDIFRASSKFLKSGVKAGLMLYDIALMCCRPDDVGEVPSKLEILIKQASELATTAVENGRWHHVAASRALADQLVPSVVPRDKAPVKLSSSRMFKSASSANFSSQSFGSLNKSSGTLSPPGSTHTSGSDSSFEVGELGIETEECEEWAAAVIADVSLDAVRLGYKSRSVSDASNSSCDDASSNLSSSPQGFWHIRPGSPSYTTQESIPWSPCISPTSSLRGTLDEAEVLNLDSEKCVVAFGDVNCGDELSGPAVCVLGTPSGFPQPGAQSAQPNKSKKTFCDCPRMIRSQSYSAFSFNSLSEKRLDTSGADQQMYRTYFLKFVDLLIEREIVSAANKKGLAE